MTYVALGMLVICAPIFVAFPALLLAGEEGWVWCDHEIEAVALLGLVVTGAIIWACIALAVASVMGAAFAIGWTVSHA